ncbi:hypothetical protein Sf25_gp220 [Shigella phage Sf25]|uniref:Thioredoxin n=1 Tax=Shigella phage Sf25 TaxID=2024310 RepID=A0A2K9VMF6_9CAUD|nr:hypothetical protein Sf25_gp220 [Shigella phage Sf25]
MSVVINNVNAVIKSLVNKKLNEWTVLRRGEPDKFFHRFNQTLDLNVIDRDVHAEILDKFKVDIGFGLDKHLQRTNGSGMGLSNRIMKALNKIGALSRINASEILRNYNKGYDLYGRLMPKLSFDQMIADLWENQRRLLALGARLAKGLDKQMIFKTNNTEDLKCFKFSIRGDDYYIRAHSTDYVNMGHHLCLAFEVLKEAGTLEYSSGAKCPIGSSCILIYRPDESSSTKLPTKPVPVRSNEKHSEQIDYFNKQIEELIRAHSTDYVNMGHHLCLAFEVLKEAGTLEYSSGAKCPIGSSCILIYRPDESSSTKLPTKPVPVRSNEKHSEQIDYFNKQIEELNISIQQYDDEIFRLSGLSSKAKSEREKLIKIVDLLKS